MSRLGLTLIQRMQKRCFDITLSFLGLLVTGWIIVIAVIIARLNTGSSGLFRQIRIGRNGKAFSICKIRTMKEVNGVNTTVTVDSDPRITHIGKIFRKLKIDELPQIWNVLKGEMSFVGPRPDVAGFADSLSGEDKIILTVCPGITGPATLKYRNEEAILREVENPEAYNKDIIWPDKVRINREYVERYSFTKDLVYILQTIFG